jgi:hypothetical protein
MDAGNPGPRPRRPSHPSQRRPLMSLFLSHPTRHSRRMTTTLRLISSQTNFFYGFFGGGRHTPHITPPSEIPPPPPLHFFHSFSAYPPGVCIMSTFPFRHGFAWVCLLPIRSCSDTAALHKSLCNVMGGTLGYGLEFAFGTKIFLAVSRHHVYLRGSLGGIDLVSHDLIVRIHSCVCKVSDTALHPCQVQLNNIRHLHLSELAARGVRKSFIVKSVRLSTYGLCTINTLRCALNDIQLFRVGSS